MAGALVPKLALAAREIHQGQPEIFVRTAVLESWRGLAGVAAWTDQMVRAVERELQ